MNILALKRLGYGIWMIPLSMFFSLETAASSSERYALLGNSADTVIRKLEQPYPALKGKAVGEKVTFSPDPLINVRWKRLSADDDLEIYTLTPQAITSTPQNVATWSKQGKHIVVSKDCDLMFDFGQVNAAWLEFECDDLKGADIESSISEFNEPGVFNFGPAHPRKTSRPKKYGNAYRLELNHQLYEGVRYAWIHLKKVERPVSIKNVRLVCQTKPVNYEGSFFSDNALLNRIWYTAAYTVRLNLMKDYFGAILIDRGDRHSWTGDAHTSQAAALVAFGNYDFIRKNIYNTAEQYNGIISYSLYWVKSLVDYYMYTGDVKTLDDLTQNACRKLEMAYGHTKEKHSVTFFGWDERLGGFENPDIRESQVAYRALSIRTWRSFADVMEKRGKKELADKFRNYAEEQTAQMRCQPEWYRGLGIFAASDAVNAQVVVREEYPEIWKESFSDRLQRVSYSPFNQYFVISAMGEMNRYGEALNTIDDCWGGQLRYGATTFFEVFRPSWNLYKLAENDAPVNNQCGYTSFTHPWSAGVAKWLSEEILGIKPLTPGFESFQVRPHLVDSLMAVRGAVPTPRGSIDFQIDVEKGVGQLIVPAGTQAELQLPTMGSRITQVSIDGKEVPFSELGSTHVSFPKLSAGKHRFAFRYVGSIESPVAQESIVYRYSASTVKEDTITQGNWKGKYGSKGYALFNYDREGTHRMCLPENCNSIVLYKNGDCLYKNSENDVRSLVSDRDGDNTRRLGVIHTKDPLACLQTMTIDLDYNTNAPYKLSLYLVDWERGGRRSAIEVFNLNNKKILTPVHMVRSYGMGCYVTFELNEPVRIRINQVRGDNAACAGLFVD